MTVYGSLISDIEDAIASGSDEHRSETLWKVTDLFITGAGQYSEEHVALFDEVIGRLAVEIEVKAREKLATRLAPIGNAPIKVVRALALDDDVAVARPVLIHSERLGEKELVATARSKGQQHLLAISQRKSLSEPVTDVLVIRGDQHVVRSVSRNAGARFSDAGFGVLVKRSKGDDMLAEHVGTRKDLPRQHFMKLIANASDSVRKKLLLTHPNAVQEVREVLAEVVSKIRADAVTTSVQFNTAKENVAARIRSGKLSEADLYECAKSGKFEEAAVTFSLLSGVSIEVVEAAMLEERPDMVLLLAKAASLSWSTVKAILLLRTSDRGLSASDVEKLLKSFERLQVDTAQRVVQFYKVRRAAGES